MKKILLLSLTTASILLMSGCSDTAQEVKPSKPLTLKEQQIKAANSLPSWVKYPQSTNGITAVGMAGYSRHGLRVMRPQAEMDARAKLAGQIQTIVSRSQKQALESVQVSQVDDLQSIFSQSTKEVVRAIPLSGAIVVNQIMTDSGDFYVQMVINKQDVISEVEKNDDIYKKNLQNAELTKKRVAEGMEVLDKMMKDLDKDIE